LEQLGEEVDEATDEEWLDDLRALDQADGSGKGSASADFMV
jgi:hypothetical protein